MSWTLRAVPLALLVLCLHPACTTDDGEETTVADTADDAGLGCAADIEFDTTAGATNPIMMTWGAACTTNEECIDLIGDPAAVCDFMAVVYELPGGYCTKPCTLPDFATRAVADDPTCDPAGGVTCLGVMGTFERCAIACTDDMQCNRAGYECRQLPLISEEGDPNFCLMPDCCEGTCAD